VSQWLTGTQTPPKMILGKNLSRLAMDRTAFDRVLCLCFWVLTALCSTPAIADEWLLPKIETYYSDDRLTRFTVTPRDLTSQLKYFRDKLRGDSSAGQVPNSPNKIARGKLQLLTGDHWATLWDHALVNDVAPVSALVVPGGRYVVTFDNWHSVGGGDNVVVIYGPNGSAIRSLSLRELLPDYYISALPRSISSIFWGGPHRISKSGDQLLLQVIIPSVVDGFDSSKFAHVELPVELSNGQPLVPTSPAWRDALATASRVANLKQKQHDEAEAAFLAPLVAPSTTDERDWQHYLQEAFFRIDPAWRKTYPSIVVLRSKDANDYGISEGWLKDALSGVMNGMHLRMPVIMISSPSSGDNLVRLLKDDAGELKPGALTGIRIYVVVDRRHLGRVVAALAPTGADVIQLDPSHSIPERPERMLLHNGAVPPG
jgi:hypothetical protein